jgi:hypothetical protein
LLYNSSPVSVELNEDERSLLDRLFVPEWYCRQAGLPMDTPAPLLWSHLLALGLAAEYSPTPLFEPDYYRARAAERDLPPTGDEGALLHWIRHGSAQRIVPSRLFDEAAYLRQNGDVAADHWFGFMHYILHGCAERRSPNPWFDAGWYAASIGAAPQEPAFLHYLVHGVSAGDLPCRGLSALVEREIAVDLGQELLATLVQAFPAADLGPAQIDIACSFYEQSGCESIRGGAELAAFTAFLRTGLKASGRAIRFFDAALYMRRAEAAGLPAEGIETEPFLHWLQYGVPAEIVPTVRFDDDAYRELHTDVAEAGVWPFAHYLLHGFRERRRIARPRAVPDLAEAPTPPLLPLSRAVAG